MNKMVAMLAIAGAFVTNAKETADASVQITAQQSIGTRTNLSEYISESMAKIDQYGEVICEQQGFRKA
jgi:hypothetical protein